MSALDTEAPVSIVFKKKGNRGKPAQARKRSPDPVASGSNAPAAPSAEEDSTVFIGSKRKRGIGGGLVQLSSGNKRRRDLGGSDDEGAEEVGPETSADSATPTPAASITTSSISSLLKSTTTAPIPDSQDAEKKDDGLYRGIAAYGSKIANPAGRFGPMKAGPDNVRMITLMDYQPDTCKDYKETGYCGFGDSCKFAHIRDDYLHGWQMDNMFVSKNNRFNQSGAEAAEAQAQAAPEEEELPFACLICRKSFTQPIQTLCGHYFCSACAIKRYAKTPKCAACGAPTGGMFNKAVKLEKRLKAQKEAEEEAERQQQNWDGQNAEGEGDVGVEVVGEADADEEEEGVEYEYVEEEEEAPKRKGGPIIEHA